MTVGRYIFHALVAVVDVVAVSRSSFGCRTVFTFQWSIYQLYCEDSDIECVTRCFDLYIWRDARRILPLGRVATSSAMAGAVAVASIVIR